VLGKSHIKFPVKVSLGTPATGVFETLVNGFQSSEISVTVEKH